MYVVRTNRQGLIGRAVAGWVGPTSTLLSFAFLVTLGWPWWVSLIGLLFNSRQFAYVGETVVLEQRRSEHLLGGGRWGKDQQPWADLKPTFYSIPLPARKPLLRLVEWLMIQLVRPVYNHKHNLWNPRRIPLTTAKRQRARRDAWGWSFNMRPTHLAIILIIVIIGATQ